MSLLKKRPAAPWVHEEENYQQVKGDDYFPILSAGDTHLVSTLDVELPSRKQKTRKMITRLEDLPYKGKQS